MVCNCEHKGRQAYATGDLLVPHPTKRGYWTTYGRADEQIMLSTGEKVYTVYHLGMRPFDMIHRFADQPDSSR